MALNVNPQFTASNPNLRVFLQPNSKPWAARRLHTVLSCYLKCGHDGLPRVLKQLFIGPRWVFLVQLGGHVIVVAKPDNPLCCREEVLVGPAVSQLCIQIRQRSTSPHREVILVIQSHFINLSISPMKIQPT